MILMKVHIIPHQSRDAMILVLAGVVKNSKNAVSTNINKYKIYTPMEGI